MRGGGGGTYFKFWPIGGMLIQRGANSRIYGKLIRIYLLLAFTCVIPRREPVISCQQCSLDKLVIKIHVRLANTLHPAKRLQHFNVTYPNIVWSNVLRRFGHPVRDVATCWVQLAQI